jgi:uncharacterized membrane protein
MLLLPRILLLAATLAMALISGFFYAYGSSVLLGLDELTPAEAVKTMQAINARVRNWMFAPSFFGALGLTAFAAVSFALVRRWTVCAWVTIALALYGSGAFLVTLGVSVPLNEQLERVNPAAPDIARIAAEYFAPWRFWNWVRTFASIVAVAALAMAWREDGRRAGEVGL